jgi:hypothetical protein
MRKSTVAAGFAVLGLAAIVYASWTSPSGITHTNDTTCSTEICRRFCTLCCLHFNPDNSSPGYIACKATYATVPTPPCDEAPPEEPS